MTDIPPDRVFQLAADYALGGLTEEERYFVERNMLSIPGLREQITTWQSYIAPLSDVEDHIQPPEHLLSKLFETIGRADGSDSEASLLDHFSKNDLSATLLFIDKENAKLVCHVYLGPGDHLPESKYYSFDDFLVLAGDFSINGEQVRIGEFHTMDSSTRETTQTNMGCHLLLRLAV